MLRKASLLFIGSLATTVFASSLYVPSVAADDETGLASIHEQRREGNRICMSSHFHNGSSSGQKTRKLAEAAAIKDWAGFTAWEYGTIWAHYKLAASKSMNCSEEGGTWRCQLEARPCRPLPKRR
ncbi:MAG TPA: hypothetical protein VF226_09655 [Hyphomicrobiaceae bacterium]|jgi:hypothetical protein